MAYVTKWYEELPSPWDIDCRGKFCIHKTVVPVDRFDKTRMSESRSEFFNLLRAELEGTGKLEWLMGQGIDLYSLKIAGVNDVQNWQLKISVLVDLPAELRTMYALRFTN